MKRTVLYAECFIQLVICYSLVMYFIELEFGGAEHSRAGHPFFLWSERVVAGIFTLEYLTRWYFSRKKLTYPFSPAAIVDLLAVLPFYVGFLIDMRSLRIVRTLRVLRLFKMYRYNAALKNLLACYWRVGDELCVLAGAILIVIFLSGTIVYESERTVQPDHFASYSDGLWWSMVTLTTVGYGDKYPVTLTGKLVASVTLLIGLGIFGSFISVIGGAFVYVIHEKRGLKGLRLSDNAMERTRELLVQLKRPITEEEGNLVIEAALVAFSLSRSGVYSELSPSRIPNSLDVADEDSRQTIGRHHGGN